MKDTDDEDYSLPNPEDYESLPDAFSSGSPKDLEDIAIGILNNSHYFCQSFVPTQLTEIRKSIATVNMRISKARSAEDYAKLSSTLRNLYASYSHLIEQNTVIFMSSYRPIYSLLTKGVTPDVTDDETSVDDISDELYTDTLSDSYNTYIDD